MCKNEFQFGLGFCPWSTLGWAHRFSGKGWRLAQPPAQTPHVAFRESGGRISQGMTLPRVHLFRFFRCICFVFCCFFNVFCCLWWFCCFCCRCFCCLPHVFAISFKSIQTWRSPIRMATCPLDRREPQHCAFFFGFTGSPQPPFSSLMCPCLLRRFLLPCPG